MIPRGTTYNRVTLVGNVGAEPRVKYLEPEVCSAQFSLATDTDGAVDQYGRPITERITDWHSILCYRELARQVELEVRTGMLLRVEGRLTYRIWRGTEGERRRSALVLADTIEILDRKEKEVETQPLPREAPTIPYGTYLEHLSEDASGLPF